MINVSRRRYYDGYEIARLERESEDDANMGWWNIDNISIPSAPNPDKYERMEFIGIYQKRRVPVRLILYGASIARSMLR